MLRAFCHRFFYLIGLVYTSQIAEAVPDLMQRQYDAGDYDSVRVSLRPPAVSDNYFAEDQRPELRMVAYYFAIQNPYDEVLDTNLQQLVANLDLAAPPVNTPETTSQRFWACLKQADPLNQTEEQKAESNFRKLVTALLHLNSTATPQNANPSTGVDLLKQLADGRYKHAYYWLGVLSEQEGSSLGRNPDAALRYYSGAASHIMAMKALVRIGIDIGSVFAHASNVQVQVGEIPPLTRAQQQEYMDGLVRPSYRSEVSGLLTRRWCCLHCSNVWESMNVGGTGAATVLAFIATYASASQDISLAAGIAGTFALVAKIFARHTSGEAVEAGTAYNVIARFLGIAGMPVRGNGTLDRPATGTDNSTQSQGGEQPTRQIS